jgi:fructose-specific phosphotransferase system IIC component
MGAWVFAFLTAVVAAVLALSVVQLQALLPETLGALVVRVYHPT